MQKLLAKKGSAYLITDRVNRLYHSGADIFEGYLLIAEKKYYFVDARYYLLAKEKFSAVNIETVLFKGLESIKTFLEEKGVSKIYLDYSNTSVEEYKKLKSFGFRIANCSNKLQRARGVKTKYEIELIKKACSITQETFYYALNFIKEGVTEKEIAKLIENKMVQLGAEGAMFETIVAFGKNSAVPHHETGETKLQKNTPILIDMGCKYGGYASDLTRTFYFGEPTKEFNEVYSAVLQANILAEDKITNNIKTNVADGFARTYLKEKGFEEYFTHSLGHGIGLEIHEYPTLSPKKEQTLKNKMVFTIEPGVYLENKFGVRIEDSVYLKNGKVIRLFTDSKELIIIK
ncbi:MAG: aminopeptidase P family protein [Clostridia bacterium]|nr:aminopeptidase P family protein [Clostridia bacterium]